MDCVPLARIRYRPSRSPLRCALDVICCCILAGSFTAGFKLARLWRS